MPQTSEAGHELSQVDNFHARGQLGNSCNNGNDTFHLETTKPTVKRRCGTKKLPHCDQCLCSTTFCAHVSSIVHVCVFSVLKKSSYQHKVSKHSIPQMVT